MTRAEEAALRAYPPTFSSGEKDAKRIQAESVDTHQPIRTIFIRAYEQAEKDLTLTIDDIELLHTFLYAVKNNKQGMFTFTRLSDEQYEEVLWRFNQRKMNNDT